MQNNSHSASTTPSRDMKQIRLCFPQLQELMSGLPLIYLDSAATSLKPYGVIDCITEHYHSKVANVHRASHSLSNDVTGCFEETRHKMANFINAQHNEIIWTSGTTESINLAAFGFLVQQIKNSDEILISSFEHHSNIVPWQQIAELTGATLKIIPITSAGKIDLEEFKNLCTSKTRLLAISGLSNVLGYAPQLKTIINFAKSKGAFTLVDGAQLIMHGPVDVSELDCDFFVCSGHKMYGPDGIGILYGKHQLLEKIRPLRFGGEMISKVSFHDSSFAALPSRLEAGTPNIAGVIGLSAAIDFMNSVDWTEVRVHEQALMAYLQKELSSIKQVNVIGTKHCGIISFYVQGLHHQDIATILDKQGIALRVGQHCAMPLLDTLKQSGLIRVSIALYTNKQDLEFFIKALRQAIVQLSEPAIAENPHFTEHDISIAEIQHLDEIKQRFIKAHSWDEKYRQLLLLGKKQKPLKESIRIRDNEISGCESQAWLSCIKQQKTNTKQDVYIFMIDSDAKIIKGLASILLMAVNGKTAQTIQAFNHRQLLQELGLQTHLSPSRGNGINAIMNKIKALAKA